MLFKNVILASLAATFAAGMPMHKHHEHKRDAVETVYVTAIAKAAAPVDAVAAPAAPASSPSAGASSPAASAPAASGSGSATLGSAGAKGVTYTTYTANGGKSDSQIQSEIAQLSGYNTIRLYGVDQVQPVIGHIADNQKLILGVFYVDQLDSQLQQLISAVNGNWNKVEAITIGNELVNSNAKTPEQLKALVQTAKSTLTAAGYTGPVTTADTFIATINNPGLCDVGDFVAINAHAFFDGTYTADKAGDWLLEQIQRVATTCPNKKVVVTESGWPWQGNSNKAAVPSKENQAAAISSIKQKCGDDTVLFSGFDEDWKADNANTFGAEKYWGMIH